jgi:CheY-like chemotaxis protein
LRSMASRVWLVGDDPQMMEVLEGWLAPAGYACERLGRADAEARLAAGLRGVERVVLDACSHSACCELLGPFKDSGVPVTMLVEAEDLPMIENGLRTGAAGFLVKPVEPRTVLAALGLPRGEAAAQAGGYFPFRTLEDVSGLSQLVAGLCPDPESVQIALSELMINAVEHGNLGLGFARKGELMVTGAWRNEVERLLDLPEHAARFAFLRVECRPQEIRFLIRDQGRGFDPTPYLNLNPARSVEPHGRGIAIARMLAFPDLVFLDGGCCVEGVVRRKS